MTTEQAEAIDQAARDRASQWLAGGQLPEQIQRRIRPLVSTARKKAA